MEVQEEVMGAGGGGFTTTDQVSVLKGKRTKRQRSISPLVLTMAAATANSSYSSAEGSSSGDSSGIGGGFDRFMTPSPSSDSAGHDQLITTVDDQEADMANCLILLAQGRSQKSPESVLAVSKVAAEVYQCKTCNRCFPSFQALGGHRASHKKPNNNNKAVVPLEEKKQLVQSAAGHHQEIVQFNDDVENTTLSLQIRSRDTINNVATSISTPIITNKSRVHECSICGAEFSSGQALGGHMRRHRPITSSTTMVATATSTSHEEVKKKPRTLLSLDLNLPAPEDVDHQNLHHHRESKFPFAPKEQVIVFSASPLVDCHY